MIVMTKSNPFSKQLHKLREKLNLSQEQLASRLNVSFATVNRWETGKAKPQKAQMEAIQKLFEDTEIGQISGESNVAEETGAIQSRRRRGVSKSAVLSNKTMEQMLWDAACSIRGEKDAPKFKDYILPMLFIKRLSDVFDDEVQRLTERFGDQKTAMEILENDHSLVRFYVPPEARWLVVSNRQPFTWPKGKEPKSLGEQLTTTIRAIVKYNPSLAGVIDIVDYNETRNGEREISDAALRGVIETFSDSRYRLGLHNVEPDFLGRCYEYLLRKFAEGQGQSAGEFFTPTEVGFLIAEIMRPRPGEECYDYACGSCGLLIKLQLVCRRLDPLSKVPLKLYGQELQADNYAIGCMNRIIHDMDAEILRGDSMRNPKFRDSDTRLKKFDIVVANPMWNQGFDPDVYENDPFERFEEQGGVTTSKGDWAWLQHTMASLKDGGRAAVVLDTGAVTRGSGSKNEDKERNIRKWFVEHDFVDGVILLPDNLFYNMNAAGIIVMLRKQKPKDRKGKITLIDASQHCQKGTPKNFIPDASIKTIASAFLKGEPVNGFVSVISNEEAANDDYNLHPSRYCATTLRDSHYDINALKKELISLENEAGSLDGELDSIISNFHISIDGEEISAPSDWSTGSLESFYRITKKNRNSEINKAKEIPFIPMDLIPARGTHKTNFILKRRDQITSGTYFEKGDILLSKITPSFENGKQGIADDIPGSFGYATTEVIPIKPMPGVSNKFFLFYWLLQKSVRSWLEARMEGSTGRQRIPENALKQIPISKPPFEEEKKIAAVLRKIQRLVEIRERQASLLRELFRSSLNVLMAGSVRINTLDIDTKDIEP